MHVRVEVQAAVVSMEHARHADLAAQIPFVGGEFHERLTCGLKEARKSDLLVSVDGLSQLRGNGERHQEILRGKKLAALALQPEGGFMVLAFRAVSVAAGVTLEFKFSALGTHDQDLPAFRFTTDLDGLHGSLVTR